MTNNYDEGYRSMLSSFRIHDLQALLGAFNINKAGRKSELIVRALDMLRSRLPGFNREAYVAKICEIHQLLQAEFALNNHNIMIPSSLPRQQRQMMNMRQIQNPQQRMYKLPRYPQQSMHMKRVGLPQSQRGYYVNPNAANSNIQYISGSYQVSGPRSTLPSHLSSNQQMKTVPQDGTVIDITKESTGGNITYVPSPEIVAQIKFKKLPFYELTNPVIKPTFLRGSDRITLQNYPDGMKEYSFNFFIPADDINYVTMNRDISPGKNEYIYQFQIRIGQFEEPINNEITDCMPLGLHVRVNTKPCSMPPMPLNTRLGAICKQSPRPMDCTPLIKLAPIVSNVFKINWVPDGKNYVMCLNLVKKLTSETLIQRIIDKGGMSLEETKNYIIKKFGDVDQDLATTSYRFSLVCPLGKMRMKIPAKSIHCKHFQCFDVSTFILMNEKKPTWTCPTCNEPCLYDDIQIDNYFLEVVSSPILTESSKEIEILADGTWIDFDENKEKKKSNTTHVKKLKPIDTVDLDSDNENSDDLKAGPNPEIAKTQETKIVSVNLNLVDLTLSGDEGEPPNEKDEQENEAQAADAVQPIAVVDLEPQAQVQPQQAVTSSEQVEVIEIGTPSPPSSPTSTTEAS